MEGNFMVTHNTTAQLSYDPETGAWDGQLPMLI